MKNKSYQMAVDRQFYHSISSLRIENNVRRNVCHIRYLISNILDLVAKNNKLIDINFARGEKVSISY